MMLRFSLNLFFMFILTLKAGALTASEERALIEQFKKSNTTLYKFNVHQNDCDPTILRTSDGNPVVSSDGTPVRTGSYQFQKVSTNLGKVKSLQGEEFEISVVDEAKAKKLFDEMAAQEHIPFRYPEDGCYARAHEMARLLEKKGVIVGKVFLEGNLRVETKNSPKGYVEWWYHVAPIILVEKNGKLEPYVIDPSLFDRPVPAEEWFSIQTKHETAKRDRAYQTPRFNYTPMSGAGLMTSYRDIDLRATDATLKSYLRVQKERDKQNGQ